VLVIMDGVGIGSGDRFDAVHQANTENLDRLKQDGLFRTLRAHGTAVGLPSDDDMGNSEVGHNIMGAGRVFDQGGKRVNNAMASGDVWQAQSWHDVVHACSEPTATLHLVGLLSDGNVHSHVDHLKALLTRAHEEGVGRARIHCLFDGRDVPDRSAERYLSDLEEFLRALDAEDYAVASGGGRMTITMDRYGADWSMVQRGWEAHVRGSARSVPSAAAGIAYGRALSSGASDQYLPEFSVVDGDGAPIGPISDGDAVVMFNFRGDRAVEFAQALEAGKDDFEHFERGTVPETLLVGMMLYDGDTNTPRNFLVESETVENTVSELLAEESLTQWAGAETQKFGHVTYFWNGNRSSKFDESSETYVEIDSDSCPFEQRPWMKSAETADAVIEAIESGQFDFIRANFAGGDMVGHTANLQATQIAVEAVDLSIGRIAEAVAGRSGCLIVTADHGNADDTAERDDDGSPRLDATGDVIGRTAHTLNPVPLIVRDYTARRLSMREDVPDAGLANLGATLLTLLDVEVPASYAPSLVDSALDGSPPAS
jgi:2,3-bisphosphoglycerate-independent phosphoglycerate mutase